MSDSISKFRKEGFPEINLYDDYFEIKAIDYWEFRPFKYSEITDIKYYHPQHTWWGKLISMGGSLMSIGMRSEHYKLKVTKDNGGHWTYDAPKNHNKEFVRFIREIKKRSGIE